MIQKGIDCEVIVGEKGILYDRVQELGVKVHYLPSLVHEINPLKDFKAIIEVYKLIRKINPDIVHLHSTKAGWIGRVSSFLARKKNIFTAHGWCFTEGVSSSRKIVGIRVEKILGKITDKIICVSNYDKSLAINYNVIDHTKLEVVYNGVKNGEISQVDEWLAKNEAVIKVIMVARFSEPKDHMTVIKAISKLEDKFKLYFVGDGPTLLGAKNLVEQMDIKDRVTFLGHRDDIQKLLLSSDVFILSSKYEGLPISIIEAMRAGLPVIGSDVGGVSELIDNGKNGFLFKAGDDRKLAEIIKILEDVQLREQISTESRRCFQQKFTLDKCIAHTYSIYNEVIQNKE